MIFSFLLVSVMALAQSDGVIDLRALDSSTRPCEDFYQYSCGGWLKKTELPSDQSRWDRSFSVVYNQNLVQLREILEHESKKQWTSVPTTSQKLGDFYASCMNTSEVDKQTPDHVRALLRRVDILKFKRQLPEYLAQQQLQGAWALFGVTATTDLKNPQSMIAEFNPAGLGLPNSTYYTKNDKESVNLRRLYLRHITNMFLLAEYEAREAVQTAHDVMLIETKIAQNILPPEDLQDPATLYHPKDIHYLENEMNQLNWSEYFKVLGIKTPNVINISQPKYSAVLNSILKDTSLHDLKPYLKWRVLDSAAVTLDSRFYSEQFDFNGRVLSGKKKISPRWKVCVNAVSLGMGEALGELYVSKHFSENAKNRVNGLINKLLEAFKTELFSLDWLDESTRLAALEKLSLFTQKIGYPNHWRSYAGLQITNHTYYQNVINSRVFENQRNLNKIGGPADSSEWYMTPQMVNAYYDLNTNQINFPAGILQPPFFSETADDASNFGAIGMVIGHEITHGFDTSGSQFDGYGVMRDWWSPAVKSLFEEKAGCLEKQYSEYEVLPGVHVNGKLTITENIADQGGVKIAYAAYKLAEKEKAAAGFSKTLLGGMSGDQRFFIAMAQMWCSKGTGEGFKQQVRGDPHSPSKFRVNGALSNSPEFAKAFNCSAGTPMAPLNRCTLW